MIPVCRLWLHSLYGLWCPRKALNTLRLRQNGRHFPDDMFKCIFCNENIWIVIKIWLKFVPKGPINNIPSLVRIMAWRRPSDEPLSEPVMVSLLTHICVTRPQWVKLTFTDGSKAIADLWLEEVLLHLLEGNFYRICLGYLSLKCFLKLQLHLQEGNVLSVMYCMWVEKVILYLSYCTEKW